MVSVPWRERLLDSHTTICLIEIPQRLVGNARMGERDFMGTVVSLLPESFLERDPRDAVADLLDDPSPSLNAESVR